MKKFFCVSLVAALSLLLFSCSNFFSSSSSDNESAPNGKARVHFSLGKTDARTIMPEIYTEEDISLVELTAQKISEGEATVYKLDGENEKLSWTSLAELENVSIDIDYGTYTFVLNLSIEDGEENKTVLVQTCTLENQEINADTKELVFNMEEDSGDVSIAVSWELRDETNRIGKIKAGLYTIASNEEIPLDITGDTAEKTLTISVDGASATAKGSYSSVPSGSYLIKLFLYDNADATSPFNTITDIIKVNGYKTNYDLDLEFANLNLQYNVTFDPNGGLWEGGSDESITTTRNMYSGFIPPKEVSKDGFVLVGWYYFEDGELSADLSRGRSSDDIMVGPEMGARDYTLYAIWGKQAGGNLSTDNRALIIKTDAGNTIYQNSKINLSVTDSNGIDVDEEINYTAKILYKGQDINELGGKTYYSVDETQGVITLNGKTTPLPEANYQLYVTASRSVAIGGDGEPVTSSQTFNMKLLDGVETQIALYTYDSGSYKYYLKDSNKVDEELGEQTLGANMAKSAFDASGYFYVAYKDNYGSDGGTIYSNNPLFESNGELRGVQLPLEDDEGTSQSSNYQDFAIDLTTNILYGCAINMTSLYLYKYPNLISSASTEGCVAYDYINVSEGYFYPSQIAINDNTLYVFGYWTDNDDETDNEKWQVMVYDIPETTSFGTAKYTCDLDSMLTTADSKLSYAKYRQTDSSSPYGDMYAMDGALYLVLKPFTAWTVSNPNIYSGAIVKWVPGESEVTVRGLYSEKTVAQESIKEMYFNTERGAPPTVYSDSGHSELKTMLADSTSFNTEEHGYGYADGYKFFPNVYAMSAKSLLLDKTGFVGPAKIIGIKPKKLVIADDGYAFYTDSDMLYYKNVNRVVTIDLERFVIESVQLTKATFDSELTDYFKSATTIRNIITSAGTYYDYEASVYYFDGSSNAQSGTIEAEKSNLYLAVKEGAAE